MSSGLKKALFGFALMLSLLFGQSAQVPFADDHVLVFIEPFADLGPDTTQPWLQEGLRAFLSQALTEERKIDVYSVRSHSPELYEKPHSLQEMIWRETFDKEVDQRFETYLVRGTYSLVDDHLTVTMDLFFLKNMHVADRLHLRDRYAQLKNWKVLLGDWLKQRLVTQRSVNTEVLAAQEFFPARDTRKPSTELKDKLGRMLEDKSRQSSTDLYSEYRRQSREALGTQLEQLWHDVAFDPYLAKIHDIKAQRDRQEPDSVLVEFKVTYSINPRILDEIDHFSKSRASEISQAGNYQGRTFIDLGYTDQEFVRTLAGGDWRLTPVITVGPPQYPKRRILYHSEPRPIKPPTIYHQNNGKFNQLLVGLPGVNSMRVYTMESSATYTYIIRVGHDEMPILDKITVRFVLEKDLHRNI